MARVTLKDIAGEAGVSVMTVSNVVNGNLGRVSSGTAEEVRRIVAARGYVPNGSAQSLAAGRTRLVGLLVPPGSEDASLLVSQHDVTVMGAVEATLRQRDNHLMLRSAESALDVRDSVQRWNIDGVIVMNFTDGQIAELDLPTDVPAVLIDAYGSGSGVQERSNLVRVGSDDAQGGRLAAEHLIGLGHRHVVFCGPMSTNSHVITERLRGFREAVEAAGIPWDDARTDVASTTYADGLDAAARIAKKHPEATAVFATADALAAGIQRGLARAGLSVPGDVSVVGYDDTEVAEYVTPSLTTIAQDTSAKGRTAAKLLLDLIGGKAVRTPKRHKVSIVVRESTGPARG